MSHRHITEALTTLSASKGGLPDETTSTTEPLCLLHHFGPGVKPAAPEVDAHKQA